MRTVDLGGREIARMGLGTNRLTATNQNRDFIRQAAVAGIGLIDTAHLYTGGSSEETIGSALQGQSDVVVATKGGFRPGEGSRQILSAQIEESLRKLRTDHVDLYYLHRIDPETPFADTLRTLADHRDWGVIRNVGISAVTVEQIEEARRIVPIAAVQNQYNVLDRVHDDVVDYCTAEGIIFVPYYPLHGSSDALREIAGRRGVSESQIALAWLLQRSPQILPIPGTLSIAHLRENVASLDIVLSDDEFESLLG